MTASQQQLVEALALIFPEVMAGLFPEGTIMPTRCIMATKVGQEVLRYFNIAARPVPVEMVVTNRQWWEWFSSDNGTPMPEEAWAVGAVTGAKGDGYDGHLLLELGGDRPALLDLDFQQFARRTKGIATPPTLLLPLSPAEMVARYRAGLPVVWIDEETGCAVRVNRTTRTDWRTAPDWKKHAHRDVVGPLIRKLRNLNTHPHEETVCPTP